MPCGPPRLCGLGEMRDVHAAREAVAAMESGVKVPLDYWDDLYSAIAIP